MAVTVNLLPLQCSQTSFWACTDHPHVFFTGVVITTWNYLSFVQLLQVMAGTLPKMSRCISSLQRSETPTPARMNHFSWGTGCTLMSLKVRCKPSIWPRAANLADVRVFLNTNSTGSFLAQWDRLINTRSCLLSALLDPLIKYSPLNHWISKYIKK